MIKLLCSVLITLLSLPSQANWTQTPANPPGPALANHAGAYSFSEGRTIVFGGSTPSMFAQAGTWSFDGLTWAQVITSNSPSARLAHSMSYDLVRGYSVLFGGTPSPFGSPTLADTWVYASGLWIPMNPTISPPGRFDHAMAFHMTTGKTILFGGRSINSGPVVEYSDTWEYDGVSWSQITTQGPPSRYSHAMSYDIIRQRVVMFGGSSVTQFVLIQRDDTWEFDGTMWHHMSNGGIPGRASHSMAYDINRAVTVMQGGGIGGNETWEWNGVGWQFQAQSNFSRVNHIIVYDARIGRITAHGGTFFTSPSILNEVWTYGVRMQGSYTPSGMGCPGPSGLSVLFEPNAGATGPMIGQTSTIVVSPAYNKTFFVFGQSNTNEGSLLLPYDLTLYGMPGCYLGVSRDVTTSSTPMLGSASLQITIPYDPMLPGSTFYIQAFLMDVGANQFNTVSTNILTAIVGRL